MTPRGGSHEPEKPAALPAKAATADLRTLVDQLVKLGLDFAAEAWASEAAPVGAALVDVLLSGADEDDAGALED